MAPREWISGDGSCRNGSGITNSVQQWSAWAESSSHPVPVSDSGDHVKLLAQTDCGELQSDSLDETVAGQVRPTEAMEKAEAREEGAELADDMDACHLGPYLRPLARDWQSIKHGHIVARPCADDCDAMSAGCLAIAPALPRDGDPIGWIFMHKDEKGSQHVVMKFKKKQRSRWAWLDTKRSKAKRVVWLNSSDKEMDTWNSALLDTVREAARWVEKEHQLVSDLSAGLAYLLGSAETTEQCKTVGLCIATKNRLWQLRHALPLNIIHCWPHRNWAKLHVVDFGSTDGTLDFLLTYCRGAIDAGVLRVYTTDQLPHWHASVAKNTVHMCATEDILVNLDGDNLMGAGFPVDVVQKLTQGGYTALQYEDGEGTCGRIACYRSQFDFLRGYDEDSYPMGAQDVDLILRLKALENAKFHKVKGSHFSQAIHNDQELKVACCSPVYNNLRWGRMDTLNREIYRWRRSHGQLQRNLHKDVIGVRCWRADILEP